MAVSLSDDDAWAFVEHELTGILTTIRSDGFPVALPVWFVVIDREIYVRTALSSSKTRRIRRDPRVGFLVESGHRWTELKAVSIAAQASIVADDELLTRNVMAARNRKYAGRGVVDAPAVTVRHYARTSAIVRLTPVGRPVSWDNSRIRRTGSPGHEEPEIQDRREMKGT